MKTINTIKNIETLNTNTIINNPINEHAIQANKPALDDKQEQEQLIL